MRTSRNTLRRLPSAMMAALLLSMPIAAHADVQAERLYGSAFVEACQLPHEDAYNERSRTVLGDRVYQLMLSGDLYAWDPATNSYSLYTRVPAEPRINVEIPFQRQSENIQHELMNSVSKLIPSDEGLYGFNYMSGKIGPIDQDGWHELDVRLDVSLLHQTKDNYPHNLRNTFVEHSTLYAFHDINLPTDRAPVTTLLAFDLTSGKCTVTNLPDTAFFCRYTPGKLLCLQKDDDFTLHLAVYDIVSQTMTSLEMAVPLSIEKNAFSSALKLRLETSGMAYDAQRNIIYLAGPKTLWRSVNGGAFEVIPIIDGWEDKVSVSEAWVLTSGVYFGELGWPYAVRP